MVGAELQSCSEEQLPLKGGNPKKLPAEALVVDSSALEFKGECVRSDLPKGYLTCSWLVRIKKYTQSRMQK